MNTSLINWKRITFFVCLLCIQQNFLYAQIQWDGGGADNLWSTATNWVGDVVPGDDDDVEIIGNFSVIVNATDSCRSIVLQAANANNENASLTISNGARLGVSQSISLDDQNRTSNSATLTVEQASTLYVGSNLNLTKDNSNSNNNDMQVILTDDNSLLQVIGTINFLFTSTAANNDMGLIMTEDSRVEANAFFANLENDREDHTLFQINATGSAGDSAVLAIVTDFTINNNNGNQDFFIDMDYKGRIDIGNDFNYGATNGRAFRLLMDRDAYFNVGNDFIITKGGLDECYIYLNQSTDGNTTDAQLIVGGDMTLTKTDGDEWQIRLNHDADLNVAGTFTLNGSNTDDDADHYLIEVFAEAEFSVGSNFDISLNETNRNPDCLLDIGGTVTVGGNTTFAFTDADDLDIDLINDGAWNTTGDFTFSNTAVSALFEIDMSGTSTLTADDMTVTQNANGLQLDIELDEDAAMTISDSLYLISPSNGVIRLHQNQAIDGSIADTQIQVGGDFIINKTHGDQVEIYLNNDADLVVNGDFILIKSNTDDNDDFVTFDLDADARLNVDGSMSITMTETNRDPSLNFLLDNNSQFIVDNTLSINTNAGNSVVTMNDNAILTVGNGWNNTMTDASAFTITTNNASDINLIGNFTYTKTSGDGAITIDMDNTSTFDISGVLDYNNAGDGGSLFFLDEDAALTIGDSVTINNGTNGSVRIQLNQTADGSAADAQFVVTNGFRITKTDGDIIDFLLNHHSDLLIGGKLTIDNSNTDDDTDYITFDLDANARINVDDDMTIVYTEANRNPSLNFLLDDDSEFTIDATLSITTNAGNSTITMNDNSVLNIGDDWNNTMTNSSVYTITLNNAADVNLTGNFTYTKTAGNGTIFIDMDHTATFDISGVMAYNNSSNSGQTIQIDRDAALTVGDSVSIFNDSNGAIHIQLNQNADGSAADAQFMIGGSFRIDKDDGDEVEILLANDADMVVNGEFEILGTNTDGNDNDYLIAVLDEAFLDLNANLLIDLVEDDRNPDVEFDISGRIDVLGDLTIRLSNADGIDFDLLGDGVLAITDDFTTSNTTTSGSFMIDMEGTSSITCDDMLLYHNAGEDLTVVLDEDASITITDSLFINKTGNEDIFFRFNQNAAGAAADAQFIADYIVIDKSDGDDLQFVLSNDADLTVNEQITLLISNSDANENAVSFTINNEARVNIEKEFVYINAETIRNPDLDIFINNSGQFIVDSTFSTTSARGGFLLDMADDSRFFIGKEWTSTNTTASNTFEIELSGNADADVTEFVSISRNGEATNGFILDMDDNATFDVAQYFHLIDNIAVSRRFTMDGDAVFTVEDSLIIEAGGNNDTYFYLNQNVDGSVNDAQLIVNEEIIVRKTDGDLCEFVLGNHADIITPKFTIETSNTDDDADAFRISVNNDSRINIDGDLTFTSTEATRSPIFELVANNNGQIIIDSSLTTNATRGGFLLDMADDSRFFVGKEWTSTVTANASRFEIELSGNADADITEFVSIHRDGGSTNGNFVLDMDDNATLDVAQHVQLTDDIDVIRIFTIDGDAVFTVEDSLIIEASGNNDTYFYMNQNVDGSVDDAQVIVNEEIIIRKTAGDICEFVLGNHADLITPKFTIELSNTDDDADAFRLRVDGDSRINIDGDLTLTNTEATRTPIFELLANNNGQIIIDSSLITTSTRGGFLLDMADDSRFFVGKEWSSTITSVAGRFEIELSGNADADVTEFVSINRTGGTSNGNFVVDMDDNATFNIPEYFQLTDAISSIRIFTIDGDAVFTIEDSLIIETAGDNDTYFYLNQNVDGSVNDAQVIVNEEVIVRKTNGDLCEFVLGNHADLITPKFTIELSNTDDDADAFRLQVDDDSRINVDGDFTFTNTETSRTPIFELVANNNGQIIIDSSFTTTSTRGGFLLDMADDSRFFVGKEWSSTVTSTAGRFEIELSGNADADVTDFVSINRDGGTSNGNFVVDMDDNATFDIPRYFWLIDDIDADRIFVLDGDVTFTVDSLLIDASADNNTYFYLNQNVDGSGNDAQVVVSSEFIVRKTDGDLLQFVLSNNADIRVPDLSIEISNTDDDGDACQITLNDTSAIRLSNDLSFTRTDASRSPAFTLTLNNLAEIAIDSSFTVSSTMGSLDLNLNDTSNLTIGKSWVSDLQASSNGFDLNLNDSSTLAITDDFFFECTGGAGIFQVDMIDSAVFTIGNAFYASNGTSGVTSITLDGDAYMNVTDSFYLAHTADNNMNFYLNVNSDGAANDAQLNVGTNLRLVKSDGDAFVLSLQEDSDLNVIGDFYVTGTNADDDGDNYEMSLGDDARLDIDGDLFLEIDNTQSPDLTIDILNNSVIDVADSVVINTDNTDLTDIGISNAGQFNIGSDFIYTGTASSGFFRWDMDNTASSTIGGNVIVTNIGPEALNWHLDRDASIDITGNMTLMHNGATDLNLYLNNNNDGSTNDAQLNVGGDLNLTLNGGNNLRVYMSNDADLDVGGTFNISQLVVNSNSDIAELRLNDNAAINVQHNLNCTLNQTDNRNDDDFQITLNNASQINVGLADMAGPTYTNYAANFTLTQGEDYEVTLNNTAQFNVYGDLNLIKTSGDEFIIDMNGTSNLHVYGNLDLDNDEDADLILIRLDGTAAGLDVDGNIDFLSASSANRLEIELQNASSLNIGGDFLRNGAGNNFGLLDCQGNSIVTYDGAGTQILSEDAGASTDGFTYQNLVINNTSGSLPAITMEAVDGGGVTVNGALTLTNGQLDLNSETITIEDGSTSGITRTNGSILSEQTDYSNMVRWNIGSNTGDHLFPFSNASNAYIPCTFNLTAGDVAYVSLATYPTAADNTPLPAGVANVNSGSVDNSANVVDRFWSISKTGPSGTATVTFTYEDAATPANGETNLRAQRYNSSTNIWDDFLAGQSANATANTVTTPGITTFSTWTLVQEDFPLPVELISFSGELNVNQVDLNWQTASELNNSHFLIEKSIDAIHFQEIGFVQGHGTSQIQQNYAFTDLEPASGINYYRLKQIDFDGTFTYSKVIDVAYGSENLALSNPISIYPNPTTSETLLEAQGFQPEQDAVVYIYNLLGQLLTQIETKTSLDGNLSIQLNGNGQLAKGSYQVHVQVGQRIWTKRLLILK